MCLPSINKVDYYYYYKQGIQKRDPLNSKIAFLESKHEHCERLSGINHPRHVFILNTPKGAAIALLVT